ncbi:hypothetical protein PYW08_006006 [Mythimna loreyi]|uniref:Uncharacterized protein n=1 Tax=Mythimna loreyi TaxID=667449 RepID=A0ACC2QNI5_9NEOP|nr:hypothetical protein PYW08_006006 [Mythimna loreyi]
MNCSFSVNCGEVEVVDGRKLVLDKVLNAGKMVRNYKKKRDQDVNEEDISNAILAVVDGNMKLRKAAEWRIAKSWKKLRDSYRKGISLRETRSGSARTVEHPLKFEKELEFIKPFIQSRKQISNVTSSPEDSDITTDGEYQSMSQRPQSQLLPSPRPQSQLSNRTSSSNEQPLKMSNLLLKQYFEGKKIEDDPTISFFITMGRTVKTMPKNIQAKLKCKIFRLINETEIRLADDTGGGNMTRDTAEFNLSATENSTTMPPSSMYPLETTSINPRSVTENYNETNIPTASFSYTPSIIPAAEKKSITSFSYKSSKIPSTSTSYQETNKENIYETNSPLPIYSSIDPPPSPYIPHAISKSQKRSSDSVLREEDYDSDIDTTFDY